MQVLLRDPLKLGNNIDIDQFPFVLGREHCQAGVWNGLVSRKHCCLFVQEERIWVQDMESRNGTYVNDEKLQAPQLLKRGDRLRLGPVSFEVAAAGQESAPRSTDTAGHSGHSRSAASLAARIKAWWNRKAESRSAEPPHDTTVGSCDGSFAGS